MKKNSKTISLIFSCLFNLPGWSVTKLHSCESQNCFPSLTILRKFVPMMTTTLTILDEYFLQFSSDILDLRVVVEPCRYDSMSVVMEATRWRDPTRWLHLHPLDQCSKSLRRHCFLVWKWLWINIVNNHPNLTSLKSSSRYTPKSLLERNIQSILKSKVLEVLLECFLTIFFLCTFERCAASF
jgi:hypothetical protein